jgi:hypothetical protein
MNTTLLAAIICLALSGEQPSHPGSAPHAQPEETQAEKDTRSIRKAIRPNDFDEALRIAAKSYKNWVRVSDMAHWAPTMCRSQGPASALNSESDDEDTHGKKLYHLYSNIGIEYNFIPLSRDEAKDGAQSPTIQAGTVVVKETWTPVEVDLASTQAMGRVENFDVVYPPEYHVTATKAWKMGEQRDLFIMLRTDDKKMEGTDEGWVYAVVSKDGEEVRSAGRIDSCMGCHKEAKFERLFGPEWARQELERK